MATTTRANTFLQRLIGAAALDSAIYEEVEADPAATGQAFVIVVLSSLAAGFGLIGLGGTPLNIAFTAVVALMMWAAWSLLTFVIGTQLLPAPETRSDVGELLRTTGFAATPGFICAVGVLPGASIPAFVIGQLWMIAAMIVAVRQALDYDRTSRAVGVCVLGWGLALAFVVVIGLVFGRPVS